MFPALIGLGGSLFSAMMQGNAQKRQSDIAQANLNETRRNNMQQYGLATAPRVDAYGNRQSYNEGEGFRVELSPLQKALMGEQQNEQLRGFLMDAPRQRDAANRQDKRSQLAHEMFTETMRNRPRPVSEKEVMAETLLDTLDVRSSGNSKENSILANIAMRSGKPGALQTQQAAAKQGIGQPSMAETLMMAKSAGRDEFSKRDSQQNSALFSVLQALQGIADGTTGANLSYDNEAGRIAGEQERGVGQILQTLRSGQAGTSQAMQQMMNIAGKTVDTSPIFKALQGIASAMPAGGVGAGGSSGGGQGLSPMAAQYNYNLPHVY